MSPPKSSSAKTEKCLAMAAEEYEAQRQEALERMARQRAARLSQRSSQGEK